MILTCDYSDSSEQTSRKVTALLFGPLHARLALVRQDVCRKEATRSNQQKSRRVEGSDGSVRRGKTARCWRLPEETLLLRLASAIPEVGESGDFGDDGELH